MLHSVRAFGTRAGRVGVGVGGGHAAAVLHSKDSLMLELCYIQSGLLVHML